MNPITNFFSAATSRSYKIVTIVDNSRIAQLGYKVMHSQIQMESFWDNHYKVGRGPKYFEAPNFWKFKIFLYVLTVIAARFLREDEASVLLQLSGQGDGVICNNTKCSHSAASNRLTRTLSACHRQRKEHSSFPFTNHISVLSSISPEERKHSLLAGL